MHFFYSNKRNLLIFILIFLTIIFQGNTLYSKFYRKCLLQPFGNHSIGVMDIEKVTTYRGKYQFDPRPNHFKKLEYINNTDLIYLEYVGAGGSGQVYLIQHQTHSQNGIQLQPKIAKRFFLNREQKFMEENFIMNKLKRKIQWLRQVDPLPCQDCTNQNPTIALYPYTNSVPLHEYQFSQEVVPLLLYKLCLQVQKAHKNGFIHYDLKMGNFLISQQHIHNKLFKAQLIDWNLANFYYPGYAFPQKKGTIGYYAPELIFKSLYITPACDIWSLGVVLFQTLTKKKPFPIKCSRARNNNLEAIASLVSAQSIVNMFIKYRYSLDKQIRASLENIFAEEEKYKGIDISEMIPQESMKYFNGDLIDLFRAMFKADPQQRILISDVVTHKYFNQVRKLPPMFQQKFRQKAEVQRKNQQKRRMVMMKEHQQQQKLHQQQNQANIQHQERQQQNQQHQLVQQKPYIMQKQNELQQEPKQLEAMINREEQRQNYILICKIKWFINELLIKFQYHSQSSPQPLSSQNPFYTKYYRKCYLELKSTHRIQNMDIERVPIYQGNYNFDPKPIHEKQLQYISNFSMLYLKYIGAGGSGQVYLIQTKDNQRGKIEKRLAKRFFKEKQHSFRQQNYIMAKIGQQVQWMKQSRKTCPKSLYPYHGYKPLSNYQIKSPQIAPYLIYRLCKQLEKTHKVGIIHSDIKIANFLILQDSLMPDRLFSIKLIDWNLAYFYYPGYWTSFSLGTPGYYSPQQLLKARYLTPAIDIWSLAITIYKLLAEEQPYPISYKKNKKNNLEAVSSLVGLQSLLDYKYKYHIQINPFNKLQFKKMIDNQQKYKFTNLLKIIPQQKRQYFDQKLINLLEHMLRVDPQKRLTIEEVLKHPYFDRIYQLPQMYVEKNKKKGKIKQKPKDQNNQKQVDNNNQ